MLKLKDFSVEHILDNVSTTFDIGKTYVVMGSNGVGKSTLLHGIMGRPDLNVSGEMTFMGSDLSELETDERARLGMFVGFQDFPSPAECIGICCVWLILSTGLSK